MLDKKIYLDWKLGADEAVYNLYKEYNLDFLNNDEVKNVCFNVSMLEPLQQFEYLGACISKWDYCLYQHEIDEDSYCLSLVESSNEQDFLKKYDGTVSRLFTKKKLRKRRITDISDKRHIKVERNGNIQFCGEYLLERTYKKGSSSLLATKLDSQSFFCLDPRIDRCFYLESQRQYAVTFLEGNFFKLAFTKQLEDIDYAESIDLNEKTSLVFSSSTILEVQDRVFVFHDFKLYELSDELELIAEFPYSAAGGSPILAIHEGELLVFFAQTLYGICKYSEGYRMRIIIESIVSRHSICFLENGVFVYPKVNPKKDDFWAKLVFVELSGPRREVLIPRMEGCYLRKHNEEIFIQRWEYYYGSFDTLQIYNFHSGEFFTLKDGNFLSTIRQIYFWNDVCYLLIEDTVYMIDDIHAYFKKTDLP